METLSFEAQTALVSFSTAVLIGGPFALIGAGRVIAIARLATRFAMRRQLATSLGLGLLGCVGAAISWPFGVPDAAPPDLLANLFH